MPTKSSLARRKSALATTRQAEEHFSQAAHLNPTEPNVYAWVVELLRHFSWQPAVKVADYGIQQFPSSTRLKAARGIAFYADNRYKEAAAVFSDLLTADPGNATWASLLGRNCALIADATATGCDSLQRFADQHPQNAEAATYAATALLHQPAEKRDNAKARALLQQAIAADPKLADAYYQLGVLDQEETHWQDSTTPLEKAIALNPAFAEAHYRLARAYSHLGRRDDAAKQIELQQRYAKEQKDSLDARLKEVTTFLTGQRRTGALFMEIRQHALRAIQLRPISLRLHSRWKTRRVESPDRSLALPACPRPHLFLRVLLTRSSRSADSSARTAFCRQANISSMSGVVSVRFASGTRPPSSGSPPATTCSSRFASWACSRRCCWLQTSGRAPCCSSASSAFSPLSARRRISQITSPTACCSKPDSSASSSRPPACSPAGAPTSPPPRASVLLLLWEWFRIYFESGAVKLLSGDPTWRNFTAMDEYYQNGPLPTWIGWYVQHLPEWFHTATAVTTLLMELVLVFMAFLPRRWRIVCFCIVTPWQIGVILTANYTFLNYLVLVARRAAAR